MGRSVRSGQRGGSDLEVHEDRDDEKAAGDKHGEGLAEAAQGCAVADAEGFKAAPEAVPEVEADDDHGDHVPGDHADIGELAGDEAVEV